LTPSAGGIRWLIDFRPFAGCEKGTAELAHREKEVELGNAAQLNAPSELTQSIKSPESGEFKRNQRTNL
jgi:hypothetical protein